MSDASASDHTDHTVTAEVTDDSVADVPTDPETSVPTTTDDVATGPVTEHANPEPQEPSSAADSAATADVIEPAELDQVSQELDDIELVLQNLETRTEVLDAACLDAVNSGTLDQRPALAAYQQARHGSDAR